MGMYLLELRNHTASVLSGARAVMRPNRVGLQARVATLAAPVKPGAQARLLVPLAYHAPTHYRTSSSAVLPAVVLFEGQGGVTNRVSIEDTLPAWLAAPA